MTVLSADERGFVEMAKDFHKMCGCRGAEYFDTCTSEMCIAASFLETCCCSEEPGDNKVCPVHNSVVELDLDQCECTGVFGSNLYCPIHGIEREEC